MKSISRALVGALAVLMLFAASVAQAGIRDAGAKARSEFGAPFVSGEYRASTPSYVAAPSASRSFVVVPSNTRTYSYDSAARRPAASNRAQALKQPAPGARRFSYEPNTTAAPLDAIDRRPAARPSMNRAGGVHDAGSKILGQY